jgi:ribosomal-protein-alanine N-acetyltransferase
MTPPLDIRHVSLLLATPDRAAEIAAIHQQMFDPAWSEASVQGLLEHPASAAYVALTGNPKRAIGFVMSQIAGDEAEILSIGVAPDVQRSGVGQVMMEGLARALRRAEITRLFLDVADDNSGAKALYAKLGFTEIGRRKGYYQRTGAPAQDAVNLALEI